jgi:RimJ/RimL family protein N-acetyltransferase
MQRQGFTPEAVRALSEAAFGELGAKRVEARCEGCNLRNRKVAECASHRLEARLRCDDRANDRALRDTVIYVLFTEDLQPNR